MDSEFHRSRTVGQQLRSNPTMSSKSFCVLSLPCGSHEISPGSTRNVHFLRVPRTPCRHSPTPTLQRGLTREKARRLQTQYPSHPYRRPRLRGYLRTPSPVPENPQPRSPRTRRPKLQKFLRLTNLLADPIGSDDRSTRILQRRDPHHPRTRTTHSRCGHDRPSPPGVGIPYRCLRKMAPR